MIGPIMLSLATMTATSDAPDIARDPTPTITYRHDPAGLCAPGPWSDARAACNLYVVTLRGDGTGTVAVGKPLRTPASFVATRPQADAFRRALARYRPAAGQPPAEEWPCRSLVSEGETIDIRWEVADRPPVRLRYYLGCDLGDGGRMGRDLNDAVRLLPLRQHLPPR